MNRNRPLRRTRPVDWIFSGLALAAGLLFLVGGEFSRLYGTTPESELTRALGPATGVEFSSVTGRFGDSTDYVHFAVGGYNVSASSREPFFPRLVEAVQNGEELSIGVSTRRETLFPRSGWVPLYTLAIGGEVVLTYETTLRESYRSGYAAHIGGGVLTAIGLFALHMCRRNRHVPLPDWEAAGTPGRRR